MQHLQNLAAVLLDATAAEAPDLADAFQGSGSAPGQFQGLLVRQDHEQRHALPARRVAAPRGQPLVPRALGFVQFGQQPQERLAAGIGMPRRERWPRRGGGPFGRALQGPCLQVDREARVSLVDEELGFRPQHLAIRQVRPQRPVVEQAGPRIHLDRQDPDFRHHSPPRRGGGTVRPLPSGGTPRPAPPQAPKRGSAEQLNRGSAEIQGDLQHRAPRA
jgi:hypothetical protein